MMRTSMQTSYLLSLICGLLAVASVLASPHRPKRGPKRAVCQTGNCLDAFQATQPATRLSEASKYCSQYLSTSIEPHVVNALIKTTNTLTPADTTITADVVLATVTISIARTTTITTGKDKLKARNEVFPTFAEHCTATATGGKAAQITSACSCLLVNTPPVTIKTETQTVVKTAPTTVPVATIVPTSTQTVTVTTATVFVYVPPPPNCQNPLTC